MSAAATTVDPVGRVFVTDPLTFDGGLLQRGGRVAGGASTSGGLLELAGESTFFRELSLRVDYTHDFAYGPPAGSPDGHRIGWRLRMPIIQSPRYGRLDAWQFTYRQELHLGPVDPLPAHVFTSAFVWARAKSRRIPATHHLQLGPTVRDRAQAGEDGARAGLVVRGASSIHLGQPKVEGVWSSTLGIFEAQWQHYGLVPRMHGRLTTAALCPAVHLGRGNRAATFGLYPQLLVDYLPDALDLGWGGFAVLQSSQLPRLE